MNALSTCWGHLGHAGAVRAVGEARLVVVDVLDRDDEVRRRLQGEPGVDAHRLGRQDSLEKPSVCSARSWFWFFRASLPFPCQVLPFDMDNTHNHKAASIVVAPQTHGCPPPNADRGVLEVRWKYCRVTFPTYCGSDPMYSSRTKNWFHTHPLLIRRTLNLPCLLSRVLLTDDVTFPKDAVTFPSPVPPLADISPALVLLWRRGCRGELQSNRRQQPNRSRADSPVIIREYCC
ncbi:hypothetical protein EYF80_061156 [Liparis tanakae]|uniref:Uncharacterized protein n=1 Tax=Liparis tanakae TaxID=230148 RepID=A0A4Z2EIV9_9TELE|nr:hypothetical protein EYF80_061156 [Liparis tanakae]